MREHEYFIDILRIAATCAVVLLHTVSGVMDVLDMSTYPLHQTFFMVIMDLTSWSVPVFIMISGFLFLQPLRKLTWKEMLSKYCRRVVLALFLFGVPYAVLELVLEKGSFGVDMVPKAVGMVLCGKSWAHLWYLYLILILYLCTPVLRLLLGKVSRGTVIGIEGFLFASCSLLPWWNRMYGGKTLPFIMEELIYLFYYLAGYLFATAKSNQHEQYKKGISIKRLCFVGVSAMFLSVFLIRVIQGSTFRMAYAYPLTVVMAVSLFGLVRSCRNIKKAGWLQKTAALCFTVYLIHPVFLNFYYKFLHVTPLDFTPWYSVAVFFLGAFIPSVALAWVLRRFNLLTRWVL